jgi:hypothetical protein
MLEQKISYDTLILGAEAEADQNRSEFLLHQQVVDGDAGLAGAGGPFRSNNAINSYLIVAV